ncbi:TPA: hypothetical protein ACH3X2_014158, partial [Trebouxia sp. C0005]
LHHPAAEGVRSMPKEAEEEWIPLQRVRLEELEQQDSSSPRARSADDLAGLG